MQALRDEDITIFGAGDQTRSFCYVDDLVDGFVRMMATPADVTGWEPKIQLREGLVRTIEHFDALLRQDATEMAS